MSATGTYDPTAGPTILMHWLIPVVLPRPAFFFGFTQSRTQTRRRTAAKHAQTGLRSGAACRRGGIKLLGNEANQSGDIVLNTPAAIRQKRGHRAAWKAVAGALARRSATTRAVYASCRTRCERQR
jgi:hypothetical protein